MGTDRWIPVHSSMPCVNSETGMLSTKLLVLLKEIDLVCFARSFACDMNKLLTTTSNSIDCSSEMDIAQFSGMEHF